jgi:hypothetical protein
VADVAAISVISSATVGVLGVLGTIYGQRVTLRNEDAKRQEARRDDLRAVLDDAAKAAVSFTQNIRFATATVESFAGQIETAGYEMTAQLARLGVRIGPDAEVFAAYDAASRAMERLWLLTSELPSDTVISAVTDDPAVPTRFHAIFEAETALSQATERFLTASSRLVGAT